MNGSSMEPQALLEHGDFVRGLAKSLLFDEHTADDVVQQTWLAYIRRPPREAAATRSWLGSVVRHFAFHKYRGRARIARREEAGAKPEALPSAADVVERESARREVVDAVLALEEPYRSAILLRYYENLPPREIAKRLGIPVETVRTHVKRGQEQLRRKLDALHGGDRRAWCLGLVPIAAPLRKAAFIAGGAGIAGGLVMGIKMKVAISLLVLSLGPWIAFNGISSFSASDSDPTLPKQNPAISDRVPESSQPIGITTPLQPSARLHAAGERPPLPQGIVVDQRGGPIPNAKIFVYRSDSLEEDRTQRLSRQLWKPYLPESAPDFLTDANGRFPIDRLAAARSESLGLSQLIVGADGYLPVQFGPFQPNEEEIRIVLDRALSLSGRLLDAETGEPLKGTVSISYAENRGFDRQDNQFGGNSEDDGRFTILAPARRIWVGVRREWYETFETEIEPRGGIFDPIEIRLEKNHWTVPGEIVDEAGRPVPRFVKFHLLGHNTEYFSIWCVQDANLHPALGDPAEGASSFSGRLGMAAGTLTREIFWEGLGFRARIKKPAQKARVILQVFGESPQVQEVHQGDGLIRFVIRNPVQVPGKWSALELGDVRDSSENLVSRKKVAVFRSGEDKRIAITETRELSGTPHRFSIYSSGSFDVFVQAEGLGWTTIQNVECLAGRVALLGNISLPKPHSIHGTVALGPKEIAWVRVLGPFGREYLQAKTEPNGAFALDGLGEGPMTLEVRIRDAATDKEIRSQRSKELFPAPEQSLKVVFD